MKIINSTIFTFILGISHIKNMRDVDV